MDQIKDVCPICEEGQLEIMVGKNRVEYNNRTRKIDVHYSVCTECGCESADTSQLRLNKRAMVRFKKDVDGLLSGTEVRQIRVSLDIKQNVAANLFGGGPVAFSKYESDDVAQSESMDKLLRVAKCVPGAFEYLQLLSTGSRQASKWQILPMPKNEAPLTGTTQVRSFNTPINDGAWKKAAA